MVDKLGGISIAPSILGTDFGVFEVMPKEMIKLIISFAEPQSIPSILSLNKTWRSLGGDRILVLAIESLKKLRENSPYSKEDSEFKRWKTINNRLFNEGYRLIKEDRLMEAKELAFLLPYDPSTYEILLLSQGKKEEAKKFALKMKELNAQQKKDFIAKASKEIVMDFLLKNQFDDAVRATNLKGANTTCCDEYAIIFKDLISKGYLEKAKKILSDATGYQRFFQDLLVEELLLQNHIEEAENLVREGKRLWNLHKIAPQLVLKGYLNKAEEILDEVIKIYHSATLMERYVMHGIQEVIDVLILLRDAVSQPDKKLEILEKTKTIAHAFDFESSDCISMKKVGKAATDESYPCFQMINQTKAIIEAKEYEEAEKELDVIIENIALEELDDFMRSFAKSLLVENFCLITLKQDIQSPYTTYKTLQSFEPILQKAKKVAHSISNPVFKKYALKFIQMCAPGSLHRVVNTFMD